MQATQTTSTGSGWSSSTTLLSGLLLALATYALHGSALDGYWRFDDGANLLFAVQLDPWQYFFSPALTLAQSGANVTPWNAFFYGINLALFGTHLEGHYAHLLALIWAASWASVLLLRLWLPLPFALLGACLFLMGAPTVLVAQQLMVGHYATGLVFSVLSLLALMHGVRRRRAGLFWLGAGLYLLATTCKEVYVPLVGLVPFLLPGNCRQRLRASLPYLLVAGLYFVWRYSVLGTLIGGYSTDHPVDALARLQQFARVPLLLFGDNRWGYLGIAGVAVSIGWAIRLRAFPWRIVLVSLLLLLAPLLPLTALAAVNAPDRYLYAVWWALSMLTAVLLARLARTSRLAWPLALMIVLPVLVQYQNTRTAIGPDLRMNDTLYRAAMASTAGQAILAPAPAQYYAKVLSFAIIAQGILQPGQSRGKIIAGDESLEDIRADDQILAYEPACDCMRDAGARRSDLQRRAAALAGTYVAGKELALRLEYADGCLRWRFGPYPSGSYMLSAPEISSAPITPTGMVPWPRGQQLHLHFIYQAPEGWRARSPDFVFDPGTGTPLDWKGLSSAHPG